MVCGGFSCTRTALCGLNVLYVVSRAGTGNETAHVVYTVGVGYNEQVRRRWRSADGPGGPEAPRPRALCVNGLEIREGVSVRSLGPWFRRRPARPGSVLRRCSAAAAH